MQNKKNPKADIGRNSSIYFAVGLALMMFLSYGTINYKVYDKDALGLDKVNMDALDEEEVPITEQIKPPPQSNPVIGNSKPKVLPLTFRHNAIGDNIRTPIIICAIVPQPPVSPPSSKILCGNQYIPHDPADIANANAIL